MAEGGSARAVATSPEILIDRILPRQGLAWDAVRILSANLLMVLCAQIAVPLPWTPVPITGQTFGLMLVGALLGARRATLTLVLYLLEGAAGLPVFQPFGLPGAARLWGPTAGYLWAFPVAAYVTGWLAERGGARTILRMCGCLAAGQLIVLTGGCAWLVAMLGLDVRAALVAGALPFLPSEIVKISLAAIALRSMAAVARPTASGQ